MLQQLCCVEGGAPLEAGLEAGGRVGGVVGAGGAGAPGVGGAVRGGGELGVEAVAEGGQLLEVVPAPPHSNTAAALMMRCGMSEVVSVLY